MSNSDKWAPETQTKISVFSRIFDHIIYVLAYGADFALSHIARGIPKLRKPLHSLIWSLRQITNEPFDDMVYEYGRTYDIGFTCPACLYDMDTLYEDYDNPKRDKYIKIGNVHHEFSLDVMNAMSWNVECTCPMCGAKFGFEDSNY